MQIDFPRNREELKGLWREAFGDEDAFIEDFLETAFSPQRCRCAYESGSLGAMLYWLDGTFQGRKIAYVYAVATAQSRRGRGLCRALMEDTHALLKEQGYAAAMLYPATQALEELYRKLGYVRWGRGDGFSCAAGGSTPIWAVSPREYGRLRRELLPEDGLLQEGASLEFLARFARLYAGPGFLLAAGIEGQTLQAPEFLGSRNIAPAIVASLGCKTGTFRQGVQAMILPLEENVPLPGYLGLVFD